jgi:syntaxin-binding protein 1
VDKLCDVEQDLAMGEDADGEKIRDAMYKVGPVLLNSDFSNIDKVRIIALYILLKNGMSEINLTKLANHAQLEPSQLNLLRNLSKLGVNVVSDVSWRWELL